MSKVLCPEKRDDGLFYWDRDLKVRPGECGEDGVFAARPLSIGTCIPIIGFDVIRDFGHVRLRSGHTFQCSQTVYIDGDPRICPGPYRIGAHGLAIAMKINEPPKRMVPNCLQKGRWIITTKRIEQGVELLTRYTTDAHYTREYVTTDYETLPYQLGQRATEYKMPEAAQAAYTRSIKERQQLLQPFLHYPWPRRLTLFDYYVCGRRTGLGYNFDITDIAPVLVVRPTDWIHPVPGVRPQYMCRGLFVGTGQRILKGTIITTYSGPLVDQPDEQRERKENGAYLATVDRGRTAIRGYRHTVSHHGMAQFANDIHGAPCPRANAMLDATRVSNEILLVALREIKADEEILVNLSDHRTHFVHIQPSFTVNKCIEVGIGTKCLLRLERKLLRLADVVCRRLPDKQLYTVRWYKWHDPVFLPCWVNSDTGTVRSHPVCPDGDEYVPFETPFFIENESDVMVHGVELQENGALHCDLADYIRTNAKTKVLTLV